MKTQKNLRFFQTKGKKKNLYFSRYSAIKKKCVVELGLASQFTLAQTVRNEQKRLKAIQKIAMQVNAKLGGELWASRSQMVRQ